MSKFKKYFGVAAVIAAAAGVIAYFMKKDRAVEPEFETPDDEEEFEQDLKDLFDDCKKEAPVAEVKSEQPEEAPAEEKAQPEEEAAEEEETAEEAAQEDAAEEAPAAEEAETPSEEKKAPELEQPEEAENRDKEISVEAPAEEQK